MLYKLKLNFSCTMSFCYLIYICQHMDSYRYPKSSCKYLYLPTQTNTTSKIFVVLFWVTVSLVNFLYSLLVCDSLIFSTFYEDSFILINRNILGVILLIYDTYEIRLTFLIFPFYVISLLFYKFS